MGRIEHVLEALSQAEVRYLVVGGVAVVLHGHLRTTLDLDLVVQLDPENLEAALRTLGDLGFQPQAPVALDSFADPRNREAWFHEKNMTVFSLWNPEQQGFAVDLFVQEPFDFPAAYERSALIQIQGSDVHVLSLEDLIAMKRAAGRPQDRLDIESLEGLAQKKRPVE